MRTILILPALGLALGLASPVMAQDAGAALQRDHPPGRDCGGDTLEMNACAAAARDRALARQAQYLEEALKRTADRPELAAMIRDSDAAFGVYRKKECGAVWEDWKDGTIRTIQALSCEIELTDQRTHDIWQHWLTFMDSTPSLLPEPGPTL